MQRIGIDFTGEFLNVQRITTTSEAYRIRLAHLFDPYLAVSASQMGFAETAVVFDIAELVALGSAPR
jgi:hypothetical protein